MPQLINKPNISPLESVLTRPSYYSDRFSHLQIWFGPLFSWMLISAIYSFSHRSLNARACDRRVVEKITMWEKPKKNFAFTLFSMPIHSSAGSAIWRREKKRKPITKKVFSLPFLQKCFNARSLIVRGEAKTSPFE